jgi:hypothetical protein
LGDIVSRKPPSPGALLFLTLLLFTPALSGAVTITGDAFARGQTDHSGIKAVFLRIAPSSLLDSTLTNSGGHYSIDLQTGIYTVTFSRDGFFSKSLTEVSLYSSQNLPDVTLIPLSSRLLVPADFSTIQSAIDAARMADTVLVSPGRYLENINYKGKNIVLGSLFLTTGDTAYVSNTIIDGNKKARVVTFDNNEDSTTVLCGFTITNGYASGSYPTFYGGGILCYISNPVLMNLKISGNHGYYGGGLFFYQGNAQIRNSIIEKNDAVYGGGMGIEYAAITVINTVYLKIGKG